MKHETPQPNSPVTNTLATASADVHGGIDFNGTRYSGPVELYRSALPGTTVPLHTFLTRVRRLAGRDYLSPATIEDALHMPLAPYKANDIRWCVEEQDTGLPVAQGSAPTKADADAEMMRYVVHYAQDGPVRFWMRHDGVTRRNGRGDHRRARADSPISCSGQATCHRPTSHL